MNFITKTRRQLYNVRHFLSRLALDRKQRRHGLVGPAKVWKQKRAFQYAFLTSYGLQQQHILLDIGCGTLRGGIPLIDYLEPRNYIGIDNSERRLAEARRELSSTALNGSNQKSFYAETSTTSLCLGLPMSFGLSPC